MTLRRLIPALLLTALLLPGAATARISQWLGRTPYQPGGEHPGWTRAHASAWLLNGIPADVEVWSASESLSGTLARMRAEAGRQGGLAVFLPGDESAWGVVALSGRLHRILCTASEGGRRTLVFVFSQSEADFLRSLAKEPPVLRLPEGLPAPPGARPLFTAANRDSGAFVAVLACEETAAQARENLERGLAAAGWSPAAGPSSAAGGAGVYVRPGALCVAAAKMSGHDGSCTVTLLHRRLNAGEAP